MIQDIDKIKQELIGFVEVDADYDFPMEIPIKYLTLKNGCQGFCKGGKYVGKGNNSLIVKNNIAKWSIKLNHYNPDSSILFRTRLFIPEKYHIADQKGGGSNDQSGRSNDQSGRSNDQSQELEATIRYQQKIIETLTTKYEEISRQQKNSEEYQRVIYTQQKDIETLRNEINHLNDIIRKISQSHPMLLS